MRGSGARSSAGPCFGGGSCESSAAAAACASLPAAHLVEAGHKLDGLEDHALAVVHPQLLFLLLGGADVGVGAQQDVLQLRAVGRRWRREGAREGR